MCRATSSKRFFPRRHGRAQDEGEPSALGRGGADAGRDPHPLRPLDPCTRRRDLLLRLRRPIEPRGRVRRRPGRTRPDSRRRSDLVRRGATVKTRFALALAIIGLAAYAAAAVLATPVIGVQGTNLGVGAFDSLRPKMADAQLAGPHRHEGRHRRLRHRKQDRTGGTFGWHSHPGPSIVSSGPAS